MILFPPEECKVARPSGEAAAQENGTPAEGDAFSSAAFREPTLRAIASGGDKRPTEAFTATAFREPILHVLAQLSER
jgi:hypothetical protein